MSISDSFVSMKDRLSSMTNLPLITATVFLVVSCWLSVRATFNYFFLMVGQFLEAIPVFIPFGSPLKPSMIGMAGITVITILGWLFSTKIKKFQSLKWRRLIFGNMIIGITFYYAWYATVPVYKGLVPYLQERLAGLEVENVWHGVLLGNTDNLMVLLVFIPTIVVVLLLLWIFGQYSQHSADINQAFEEFEFKSNFLQRFVKMGEEEKFPDVVLGPDSETKELIIQPGKDRTLNNIIIGSIGTGKTAALVLPILNQDLHWMTRFINDYPSISQREDYNSEDVKGAYLNGISVIEPSNDLCQKAFELVKAHNIPSEPVFYIDPTNPNTPNINPMQGPVDQVAEAFAMVIEGLAEGGDSNFFFQQSERNHLKHYIYLLKLHEPDKEVTFDMLLNMYESPQLVRQMHVKLKKTIPNDLDSITDRDERNHWEIVKQIDKWFDMNHLPVKSRGGAIEKVTHGEFRGEEQYYDGKSEYVQGLRNILNDIGANKLLRRVLFGKSDFNFDKHLEYGGVLLLNTAKGELAGLSNVLGKLVLLSLQNAVFRRKPNVSPFHHILTDEFPDYIYRPFKEFPAQSRKYKVIVTVVAQTVTQLADKYGETYMHTLIGTLRHRMVYGDIPDFDAQLFSKIFGEKERFEEMQSEQSVSPLQETPTVRTGSSYTKLKEVILSPSDIIFQKPFQCAVKIVANNKPIPVRQIDANFVPKEEFKEAVISVEDECGLYWLEKRNQFLSETNVKLDAPIEVEEEGIEEREKDPVHSYHPRGEFNTQEPKGDTPKGNSPRTVLFRHRETSGPKVEINQPEIEESNVQNQDPNERIEEVNNTSSSSLKLQTQQPLPNVEKDENGQTNELVEANEQEVVSPESSVPEREDNNPTESIPAKSQLGEDERNFMKELQNELQEVKNPPGELQKDEEQHEEVPKKEETPNEEFKPKEKFDMEFFGATDY